MIDRIASELAGVAMEKVIQHFRCIVSSLVTDAEDPDQLVHDVNKTFPRGPDYFTHRPDILDADRWRTYFRETCEHAAALLKGNPHG